MESNYIYFNSCKLLDPLTENWTTIRDEFIKTTMRESYWAREKQEEEKGTKANYITDLTGEELYVGDFKAMPLMLREDFVDHHEAKSMDWKNWKQPGGAKISFNDERLHFMPFMQQWLYKNIEVLGAVTFNISLPGSKLNHHWGLVNDYLRFHLVLKQAKGCVFDIENERHEWVDGELFGFDDCNVFHGTKHTGTEPRIIMLVDILKSAVQPYAKHWPVRENIPRNKRTIPTILDW